MNDSAPPSSTRRQLLLWTGLGATAGAIGYLGWPASEAEKAAPSATTLLPAKPEPIAASGGSQRDHFEANLHTQFSIIPPEASAQSCELVEVSPAREMVTEVGTFSSFSVLFTAPSDFLPSGQECAVQHSLMGKMSFFLTPVGDPKAKRPVIEACFTQRV